MPLGASILAVASVLTVAALVAGAGRVGRIVAVALAVADLALPFVVADVPGAHFVAALGASWGLVRIGDLARDATPRAAAVRVWQAFSGFDTRTVTHGAPRFAWRLLATGVAFAVATAVALPVAALAPRAGPSHWAVRWSAGAAVAYCMADAIDRLVRFAYALAGVDVPPMQRVPAAARSVAEFWSARWNTIVSAWLRRDVFAKVARRAGGLGGLVAAFVVSALLHAYLAAPAVGLAMAAAIGAFFLVQGAVVLAERVLRVARWPAAAAHAWVVATLLASSPLFVEPMLRVLLGR